MSYDPTLLSTSALYRLRFKLQDNDVNNEFLVDEEYTYLLSKYSDNEDLACLDAAKRMLAQFSQYTRQRESQLEVYGDQLFAQWKEYLEELVSELTSLTGSIIIGGVSADEIDRVKSNPDSVGNGYELDFLTNQRTSSFGTSPKNTNRFRSSSSSTSFKID